MPFKHDSLLVDRKEMKLTKAEKREAKRGYEIEKRLAMQGQKHYPGVIQPVYNRNNQPYVPKPVHPVGSVPALPQTTGPNCTHHHHHHPPQLPPSLGFHLPLASFIRAGVPVPSSQFATSPHHGVQLTASPTQSQGNQLRNQEASACKEDVVMIDLDELPSPTHPGQETMVHLRAQAHQSQSNVDLVRMAQHAFPSVSPAFINVLLNQGTSQGAQELSAQSSHVSNTHDSQSPKEHRSQSSTAQCKANSEALDIDVNSSESNADDSTPSKNADATQKNMKVKKAVVNTPSQEQTELQSSSPPIIVEVSLGSDQLDLSSQQETTGVSLSPTRPLVVDVSGASDELANSASQETDAVSP